MVVAFVQDLSSNLDKLSPHHVKCVFIGYSRIQRGYRCFDPSTCKYIVSTYVTFFECQRYFEVSVSSFDGVCFSSPFEPCESVVKDLVTVERRKLVLYSILSSPVASSVTFD